MATKAKQAVTVDLRKFKFTRERIEACECPAGKQQVFYWDEEEPGLGLRVTAGGAKAFIFEAKLGRQTIRMTIGPASMPIRAAKDNRGKPVTAGANIVASRLASLIAEGRDPRAEKAAAMDASENARAAQKTERARFDTTGLSAWTAYLAARRSKWGVRNYEDHLGFSTAGGAKKKLGEGKIAAGPLYALLKQPLAKIDAKAVEKWVERESAVRPTRTRLGFRLLRAFLNWCAEQDDYKAIVCPDPCKPKSTREALGTPNAKQDALQREQLAAWFAAVQQQSNDVIAAYLQVLLLVGSRKGELVGLQWADVDFKWKTMTIRDKIEGQRTIPLTPYVAQLLTALPRRNEWVFSSPLGARKRIQTPTDNHTRAVTRAGLPALTLQGLRRSFGTLSEWVECPVGVVAQIQGHKPSAIAEKHYRVRPIDLLRMWHEKIEDFILSEAGVTFKPEESIPTLRVVSAA